MRESASAPVDKKRAKRRKFYFRIAIWCASALLILTLAIVFSLVPYQRFLPATKITPRDADKMRLHFISVGQGDCTLVEFPDGDLLVVDAGDGSFVHTNELVSYIKGLNPTEISFVATHSDSDHIGGIAALIRVFGAKTLYLPAIAGTSSAYSDMLEAAEKAHAECVPLTRYGGFTRPSGAYAVCLSPYSAGETEDNDSSIVLYLNYAGVGALLTGDVGAARERKLAAEYLIDPTIFNAEGREVSFGDIGILKVSHHGSASASTEEFLSLVGAEVNIVSCGADNPYGHPASEAMARLAAHGKIYRTDELGTVIVEIGDGKFTVFHK